MRDDLLSRSQLLEAIIEGIPGGVFQFEARDDGSVGFGYRSRRVYELAHLPPDWHLGINAHPDDRDRLIESVHEAIRTSRPWSFEGRCFTASGEPRWIEGMALPTREADRVVYNGLLLDTTDRKRIEGALLESEGRFRGAFENAAIGMALISPTGQFAKVNASLCRILGYSEDELLRLGFQDVTHPEDLDTSLEYYNRARAGEISAYQLEKRFLNKSGDVVWALVAASVVRDGAGRPVYAVSQFQDITERKRVEEEKRRFYRDTIKSATQGKLDLVSYGDMRPYLASGELIMDITSAADTAEARHRIRDLCEQKGGIGEAWDFFEVAIGEAMTNAIKHAGSGEVRAGARADTVWVLVSDDGTGIPAITLPRATLRMGFSTKVSMGIGYSIMLEAADSILLCTGPDGTTVTLLKSTNPAEAISPLDTLPDTWG